jgi:Putative Ig domain/Bacterial Ig-like domain (group 2)
MGVAVTFLDDNATVEVTPGREAACAVRVENTGAVVDGILLDVLGDAAEWASVEPAQVNLLPGASQSVKVMFRPPRTSELSPGEVPFALRAMSQEDPNGSRIEESVVEVGEFSDLEASLVPKSATGRRQARYRLVLENRGNRAEHVTVEAVDPDVKLSFRLRPEMFSAEPGVATYVQLSARPRKTFFRGPNRTLPFGLIAQPDDGDAVKVDGVMLQRQILPAWLLPALGIALLAAGLILALWLTVLRPIVHSAASAAANAGKAASAAKSAAKAAQKKNAPPSAPPSALKVTVPAPTILTRTTELATATGSFGNGPGALPKLVWTSSDRKIARVSQAGVVTARRSGSVTITATTTRTTAPPAAQPTSSASASPGRRSPGTARVVSAASPTVLAATSPVVSGSVTINVVGPVKISTKALTEAALGKSYTASVEATGGTGAFTWSVSGGALPPGLSLDPGSGMISGTPTTRGTYSFTVHLADAGPPTQFATTKLTLKVVKPLAIDTSSLPGGTVGAKYSQSLVAFGGTRPYSWSIGPGTGSLPSGLRLNPKTGTITGTPTSAGTSNFLVQVSDAASPGQSATEELSINVVNPLTMTTLTLPTAVLNSQYSMTLAAFGGAQPYTWSISAGSLPVGLTLSPGSGIISGTPTATGQSTFTIEVTDSKKPSQSVSRTFVVSVVNGFGSTTSSLAEGKVGQQYSAQLTAAGGVTPYIWSLTGTLPPGLTLSPSGAISGTPTTTGIFPFTVQIVDSSSPPLSVTADLSITVVSPLKITTTSLNEAVTGVRFSQTVQAVGGTAPYQWSITSGRLPSGLTLSADTGTISGTAVTTGTSTFTITVTDSDTPAAHTASLSTSISVVEPLTFSVPTTPDGVVGLPYPTITPTHVNGGSGSYTWSITSGKLPAGLKFDTGTGTISGTINSSAQLGPDNFTITVADANDPTIIASEPVTINVVGQLTVAIPPLSATALSSFSQNLGAFVSGGVAPYTFTAVSSDGLSVDPVTGVLSGTPDADCTGEESVSTIPGTTALKVTCPVAPVNLSLKVTDADGTSVFAEYSVNVSITPLVIDPVGSLPDVSDGNGYDQPTLVNGDQPTGGYGPAIGNVGGYSFSTSKVSVSGASPHPDNNGLPCNQVGCSGLAGRAQLSINSSTGEITGTLGDLIVNQKWTFNVNITDTDPLNPNNKISVSFQLSIQAD